MCPNLFVCVLQVRIVSGLCDKIGKIPWIAFHNSSLMLYSYRHPWYNFTYNKYVELVFTDGKWSLPN